MNRLHAAIRPRHAPAAFLSGVSMTALALRMPSLAISAAVTAAVSLVLVWWLMRYKREVTRHGSH